MLRIYFRTLFVGLALACTLTQSQAQSIGQRNFDVSTVSGFNVPNQNGEGTSNGVNWKMCGTIFDIGLTDTTGGFNGFNTFNFSPPVANTDIVHVGGADFTILFERPVSSIVFYIRENGGISSIDFGIPPIVLSGGTNLNIQGTRIFPNTNGGAVRFDNVNSRSMTSIAGAADAMNLAFYVESLAPGPPIPPICPNALPVPTLSHWGMVILGLALLCLGAIFLHRRQRHFRHEL